MEIKSGQTIITQYFSGLMRWLKMMPSQTGPQYLVYGGDENQMHSGMNILSWRALEDELNML
ncbi:MAG: hypothetical protein SWO11_21120 [Thermodesulfobacteriota bacterium]|nr:hypothetical protein [Thermodesulfobacteriota bacterium]